jgi:hypothetical protein
VDSRAVQRLIGVYVPDTSHAGLVEQGRFNSSARPGGKSAAKDLDAETGRDWIRAVLVSRDEGVGIRRRQQAQPPKPTLIVEPETYFSGELQQEPRGRIREFATRTGIWMTSDELRLVGHLQDKLPGNLEVHRQSETVGQPEQQHLPGPVNRDDCPTDCSVGASAFGRMPPLLVEYCEPCQRPANDPRCHAPPKALYLR